MFVLFNFVINVLETTEKRFPDNKKFFNKLFINFPFILSLSFELITLLSAIFKKYLKVDISTVNFHSGLCTGIIYLNYVGELCAMIMWGIM